MILGYLTLKEVDIRLHKTGNSGQPFVNRSVHALASGGRSVLLTHPSSITLFNLCMLTFL